jgi:hypothetical protein
VGRIRADRGGAGVQVEGLRELNRSLKAMSPAHQRELIGVGLVVASFVAQDARGLAALLGGVAAKTAPSIRAAGYTTGAGVSFGGSGYEFAAGAEFGAYRYKQFKPWRGSGSDAGYFIYPAIRQDLDRIEKAYEEGLDRVIKRVGLD